MNADQPVLYIEDLTPGRTFESATLDIDAEAIIAFAAQFDPQPSHLDAAAARDTVFRGLVASGWHTTAVSMRLLVASEFRPAGGIVGLRAEIDWTRPVRPGDGLRIHLEVLETTMSTLRPNQGVIRLRATTVNRNDQPVAVMVLTLRGLRRPASAA